MSGINSSGYTIRLIKESINGSVLEGERFLDRGANINEKDSEGFTALMWASRSGHTSMARLLLNRGASINEKDSINGFGFTALIWALVRENWDIVKLLFKHGANLDEKDSRGRTVLHYASGQVQAHKDVVTLLIDRGANIHEKDLDGYTALHNAIVNGHEDIAELLIELGADIYDKTNDGNNALHLASESGYINLVEMLLKLDININEKNNNGDSAIRLAIINGNQDIAELLNVKYGQIEANYKSLLVGVVENDKLWSEIIEILERNPNLIEEKTEDNETALLIAVNQRSTSAVRLVMMGANLHVVDKNGQTALSIGSRSYNELIMNFFIKNSSKNMTP